MPIRRNKNGRNNPSVVATIIAENIAVPNANISRTGSMMLSEAFKLSRIAQATPPITPQLSATSKAIRTSRVKTWLNFNAARWPVANPETTMVEVWRPALPLMAAIIGTNATAATYINGLLCSKNIITRAVTPVPMRQGRSQVIRIRAAWNTETLSSSSGSVPAIVYKSSAASSPATSMIRSAVIRPMSLWFLSRTGATIRSFLLNMFLTSSWSASAET